MNAGKSNTIGIKFTNIPGLDSPPITKSIIAKTPSTVNNPEPIKATQYTT